MNREIDSLIDLAFVASKDDNAYYAEFFKLVYCSKHVKFNINENSIAVIIAAYPKDEEGRKNVTNHLKYMRYADFLQTTYWKAIACYIKYINEFSCAACGSIIRPSVHHKTYEHKGCEVFFLDDLTCLCQKCHDKFHFFN